MEQTPKRVSEPSGGLFESLRRVRTPDAELERRGQALAVLILGISASVLALFAVNIIQGEAQYYLTNVFVLGTGALLYTLNRSGYVRVASLCVVLLSGVATVLMVGTSTTGLYLAAAVPVLAAGSLIAPWTSFPATAVIFVFLFLVGEQNPAYMVLLLLFTFFSYTLSSSIDRAYHQARHQALHDALTGLPNRALLETRIHQALELYREEGRMCALLFVDLDDFKIINDSLGHEAGDQLLVTIGDRLQDHARPVDTVARLAGDEFILLLHDFSGVGELVRMASRLSAVVSQPLTLAGQSVEVTPSIGLALSSDEPPNAKAFLRNADMAMYEAKDTEAPRIAVYNHSMHERSLERLGLETDLRKALKSENELLVEYQPQFSLDTGLIVAFEALVRWQHPGRGKLYPSEFIPVAEDTGLIIPLGHWVLEQACLQARAWDDEPRISPEPVLSVNLSARQFSQPSVMDGIGEHLRATGVDARLIQVELTESTVTEDVEESLEAISRLKELGVKLALDDFGTGYSSLGTIRKYPFDTLKIDRSFVQDIGSGDISTDIQDVAVVELVSNLARIYGMDAVVEGIETEEQETLLKDAGCNVVQGYYYSEAVPAERATELLLDQR